MHPYQQKKMNFDKKDQNIDNSNSSKFNYNSSNAQFFNSQNNYDEDDMLLEAISTKSTQEIAREKSRNNQINNNKYQNKPIQSSFPLAAFNFNPYEKVNKQTRKQKISKIDNQFQELIKLNQESSQQKNISARKIPSQKEEKNKKALNRMSQQFFGNSSNNLNNTTKDLKKRRQTISTFNFMDKNKILTLKNGDLQEKKEEEQPIKPVDKKFQNEKMEVQPQAQHLSLKQNFNNNKMKDNIFEKEKSQVNQCKTNTSVYFPIDMNKSEIKLSETKKRRQRVTLDMNSLLSMLQNSQKKKKREAQQVSKKKNRVTMDLQAITSLLSFDTANSDDIANKIAQKSRRHTEYVKGKHNQEQVIYEDEKQDEFTPLKSKSNHSSRKQIDVMISLQKQKQILRTQQKLESQQDLEKQVFKIYFENMDEKIKQQRKRVQNVKKEKEQLILTLKNTIKLLKPNPKKLSELKEEQRTIRAQIHQIKSKVKKQNFIQYYETIAHFQKMLGVKIHNYKKYAKPLVKGLNHNLQGFFAEFSYNDTIFRIKKNSDQSYACRFQSYTVAKKQIFLLKLDNSIKWILYQNFMNQKLRKVESFIQFVSKLTNYVRAVQFLELSLEYYTQLYGFGDIEISQNSEYLSFRFDLLNNHSFYVSLTMANLTQNGGITVKNLTNMNFIQIPDEFLLYTQKGNKLGNCFAYLNIYLIQNIEKSLQDKINNF